MGFYIRKSISSGPFRFTLSGSGLGLSVGVKGFRIGTGPRGNYIHMGRGGLYYRASLGGGRRPAHITSLPRQLTQADAPSLPTVETGDVLEMKLTSGSEIVDQINQKLTTLPTWPWALGLGVSISVFAWSQLNEQWLVVTALLATALVCGLLARLDAQRRTVVIMYDLDEQSLSPFKHFVEAFDRLQAQRIWNIGAAGATTDWKHNAGAGRLINRQPVRMTHDVPRVVKTNIDIPAIIGGRPSVYFFPDEVLVVEGSRAGAVSYDQLNVLWAATVFMEEDGVPSDSKVVGHTWRFVNKNGGPDKRFHNNRQIPKVAYLQMSLIGPGGLQKILQFSRVLDHVAFDAALNGLRSLVKELTSTSSPSSMATLVSPPTSSPSYEYTGSDEAARIEHDKPAAWEFELTVELLRLWVGPFVDKWKELKRGGYTAPASIIREDEITKWCQERFHDVSSYCESYGRLMSQELAASWGPLGQSGSSERIKAACKEIAELAQAILTWEESVRFARVPSAFEEVRSLLPGCAGTMLDQIARAREEISQIVAHARPSQTYTLSLTPALPEGWVERFNSAFAKASRSLGGRAPTARPNIPVSSTLVVGLTILVGLAVLVLAFNKRSLTPEQVQQVERQRLLGELRANKAQIIQKTRDLMTGQNFGDAFALLAPYTSLSDPDLESLQTELKLRVELQETPTNSHSARAELWRKVLAVDPLNKQAAAERDRETRAARAASKKAKARSQGPASEPH